MATGDPACCQPAAMCRTVPLNGLECVGRARGVIAADLPVDRTDQRAVHPQHCYQKVPHHRNAPSPRRQPVRSSARIGAGAVAALLVARITVRPGASSPRCSLMRCRNRRFTRFRTTAGPTDLPTANPTSTVPPWSSPRWWTTTVDAARRWPRRVARWKSTARRRRCAAGSTSVRRPQVASRLRPLRRRPAKMARPARVRIRRRKPCVLLRLRLLGWNVRLLTRNTPGSNHAEEQSSTPRHVDKSRGRH